MMRALGITATVALIVVALAWTNAPANGARDACDRRVVSAAELVLASRAAKVYEVDLGGAEREYYHCLRAVGDVHQLNDVGEGSYVYAPPRMRLAGTLLAFVGDTRFADEETSEGTDVTVSDLRFEGSDRGRFVSVRAGRDPYARVGSLVLRSNGAFAWISCANTNPDRYIASPRGDCTRPGRVNSVYRVRSNSRRRELVARGRGIHPASLRLRGGTISWRRGDHVRRARLP
jgi:hypothetical protein